MAKGPFRNVDRSLAAARLDGLIPGDLDEDGIVGIADFLLLLGFWGDCPDPCGQACVSDIDEGRMVGFLILLGNWSL